MAIIDSVFVEMVTEVALKNNWPISFQKNQRNHINGRPSQWCHQFSFGDPVVVKDGSTPFFSGASQNHVARILKEMKVFAVVLCDDGKQVRKSKRNLVLVAAWQEEEEIWSDDDEDVEEIQPLSFFSFESPASSTGNKENFEHSIFEAAEATEEFNSRSLTTNTCRSKRGQHDNRYIPSQSQIGESTPSKRILHLRDTPYHKLQMRRTKSIRSEKSEKNESSLETPPSKRVAFSTPLKRSFKRGDFDIPIMKSKSPFHPHCLTPQRPPTPAIALESIDPFSSKIQFVWARK